MFGNMKGVFDVVVAGISDPAPPSEVISGAGMGGRLYHMLAYMDD